MKFTVLDDLLDTIYCIYHTYGALLQNVAAIDPLIAILNLLLHYADALFVRMKIHSPPCAKL